MTVLITEGGVFVAAQFRATEGRMAHIMKKQVLVYNLPAKTIARLRTELKALGCGVRAVTEKEQSIELGALAGMPGRIYKKAAAPDNAFHAKFVVICGFSGLGVDAVIMGLNRCGIGKDVLKAVLTATNSSWSSTKLYSEVSDEHTRLS